jgi:hypothetical protein
MELLNFKFTNKKGKQLTNVNEKFQFFYHYWKLVTSNHSRVIWNNNKFESHRSLLVKAINALNNDYERSRRKFDRFFKDHIYFSDANKVLKELSIWSTVSEIKSLDFRLNKRRIIDGLNSIYSYLNKRINYSKRLTKELAKLLSKNTPFDSETKDYIEFLIFSLIVELYNEGYPMRYIKKIPDILTFRDGSKNFPFEKTLRDFDFDEKEYDNYVSSHEVTLELMISGIQNLILRRKFRGFIVFKVFNLELKRPEKINFQDIVVYNPIKTKYFQQKTSGVLEGLMVEHFFHSHQDRESLFSQESTCNVIVPINLRFPLTNVNERREFFKALKKAEGAIKIFKHLNCINSKAEIRISKDHFFLADMEYKIATFGLNIFSRTRWNEVYDNDENELEYCNSLFEKLDNLDLGIEFHKKIKNVFDISLELKLSKSNFSFSPLYIVWESLLGDKEEIKKYFRIAYKKWLSKNYLKEKIFLLNSYLFEPYDQKELGVIKLTDHEIKKFGLQVEPWVPIKPRKFIKNYRQLFEKLNLPFFKSLLVNDITSFITNRNEFNSQVDGWIDDLVEEFYIERNAEVHNNIENDFSKLKLKEDLLHISLISVSEFLNSINQRNKMSLDSVLRKVARSI